MGQISPRVESGLANVNPVTDTEARIQRKISRIHTQHENIDGGLKEIIRKPYRIDESPIKTMQSTMGRKQPQLSQERRFVIQEEKASKMSKTFRLGENFTADEEELGEIVIYGKSVLKSELNAARQIPSN